MSQQQTIVIDNGSAMMKAGFAGYDAPQEIFPTVIGRPKHGSAMEGVIQYLEYLSDEALQRKGILNLHHPLDAGIVECWEDMEKVWRYSFC